MKAIDISGENLEDLLAYDDLFLDYFNEFLALPVFPQALSYNRLTGGFDEVPSATRSVANSQDGSGTPPYGVTDEERERMLEWAKEERLPLFLRTQLFREFKLLRLLLRPLADRDSASHAGSSHTVRGYSRQTESYVSSLSNSGGNSANEGNDHESDFTWSEFPASAFFPKERPISRTTSLPVGVQIDDYLNYYYTIGRLEKYSRNNTTESPLPIQQSRSKLRSVGSAEDLGKKENIGRFSEDLEPLGVGDGDKNLHRDETVVSFDPTSVPAENTEIQSRKQSHKLAKTPQRSLPKLHPFYREISRAVSAPTNYQEYVRMPSYSDFDVLFGLDEPEPSGHTYVQFEEEGVSDEQTETDMKNLEGRLQMSFQQMKEQVLGSYEGMDRFMEFLSDTAGIYLLNFWLDCEYFKDTMEDFDDVANMETRNRLFRDIKDKYKMNLTKDARDHLTKACSNASLSHTVFIRTQYDVLRRIRAYWLPRFIIHLECGHGFSSDLWERQSHHGNKRAMTNRQRPATNMSIFPSISLVNSMPVQAEVLMAITKLNSWDIVSKGGTRFDDRVKSAKTKLHSRPHTQARPLRDRFLMALTADKAAGGPFLRFLIKHDNMLLLSTLLFWQDVTEYGAAEDRSADRLLRLCHTWTIFRKYMTGTDHDIGLPQQDKDILVAKLTEAHDFIEASIFDSAKNMSVDQLEKAWLRFLKEDLKTFLDCRFGCSEGMTPPSTASAVDITVTEDNQLVITRPRPWVRRHPGSTSTERARRLRSALSLAESIDEEKLAEQKIIRHKKRMEMEKERRKAIKAAKMRQKAAKSKKSGQEEAKMDHLETEDGDILDGGNLTEDKPIHFVDMVANKQIVTLYKKYLQESESKETLNGVSLYMDIQTYMAIGYGKENKQKKDTQANYIHKTYLDAQARKHLDMTDKIRSKLATEKDRPRTPTLREIQSHVLPTVDEAFNGFVEYQADTMGIEPKTLASMSSAEISMRMESDASLLAGWNKKKGKVGKKHPPQLEEEGSCLDLLSNVDDLERQETQSSMSKNSPSQINLTIGKSKPARANVKRRVHFTKHPIISDLDSEVCVSYTVKTKLRESKAPVTRGEAGSSEKSTTPLMGVSRRRKKQTGRAQPNKDDKVGFLLALNQSAMGHLSIELLYFYKYLIRHGEEDGNPLIDRDLIFYIEVQKYKDCNHLYADEEMLRRKVQSLMDCFLESVTLPNVQVGISAELQVKTLKAAQRYLTGKDLTPTLFDEAQYAVFKELLPYWAGFRRGYTAHADGSRAPTTKLQKLLKKRLEAIENYKIPENKMSLPEIAGTNLATYTFTLHEGIKYKEGGVDEFLSTAGDRNDMSRHGRKTSVASSMDGLIRKRYRGGPPLGSPSTAASSAGMSRSSLAVR